MLSVFECFEESESLYFKLNNSFHIISAPCSNTYRIAGVYAIYKNDICYYIGQSKNLPSRLATHLTGKYKNADKVRLYFAGEDMHIDANPFHSWAKNYQKDALERNEAYLIHCLKPIENIYIPDHQDGDEVWCIEPDSCHAEIDIQDGIYSVYRDVMVIDCVSEELKTCYKDYLDWENGNA